MDKAVEIFCGPPLPPGELKTAVVVEDFKTAFPLSFDDSSAGFVLQLAERVHLRSFGAVLCLPRTLACVWLGR